MCFGYLGAVEVKGNELIILILDEELFYVFFLPQVVHGEQVFA